MPVLQRRTLRLGVGQKRLRDTVAGVNTFSLAAGPVTVMDRTRALPDFSGQDLFQRAYLRVGTNNLAGYQDYRVGSFNVGSGAFTSLATAIDPIQSGAVFEVHERLAPDEIDKFIDETIAVLHTRREVPINTVDGAWFYDIDGAASPHTIVNYLAAGWYRNPASSVNRDFVPFQQHEVVTTGSGLELRIPGGLGASLQIVLDALLQLTLGAADSATINLPDQETVEWGAAARCYDLLAARAPAQEAVAYRMRRKEAVAQFNYLARQHYPEVSKPLGFSKPFEPLE